MLKITSFQHNHTLRCKVKKKYYTETHSACKMYMCS